MAFIHLSAWFQFLQRTFRSSQMTFTSWRWRYIELSVWSNDVNVECKIWWWSLVMILVIDVSSPDYCCFIVIFSMKLWDGDDVFSPTFQSQEVGHWTNKTSTWCNKGILSSSCVLNIPINPAWACIPLSIFVVCACVCVYLCVCVCVCVCVCLCVCLSLSPSLSLLSLWLWAHPDLNWWWGGRVRLLRLYTHGKCV